MDSATCFPVSSLLCYSAQNPSSRDGAAHIQAGFALRFISLESPSLHAQWCFHDDFKQSRTESAERPSQLPSEMFPWGKQSVKTGVFHSTRTHQGSQDNVVTLSSWEARQCLDLGFPSCLLIRIFISLVSWNSEVKVQLCFSLLSEQSTHLFPDLPDLPPH